MAYTCDGFCTVDVPESPKLQLQEVGPPVEGSVKFAVRPETANEKFAAGAGVGLTSFTQAVLGGLSVNALVSVLSQPVTRLRTVIEIGVGTSRVPLARLSPLAARAWVLKTKLGGGVGTVATITVEEELTMGAEAPSAPPNTTRRALVSKFWPLMVTLVPTLPPVGLMLKMSGLGGPV